jgi:hypothetical protein
MKKLDDYGPTTDHPLDPRNAPDDDEEAFNASLDLLEMASGHIKNAIKALRRDGYWSPTVDGHVQDAVTDLGGTYK